MSHSSGKKTGPAAVPPTTVLKFGGTSVEDSAAVRRVLGIAGRRRDERLVLVVSALAGVTDQLLKAGEQAASGATDDALAAADCIRQRHEKMARELLAGAAAEHFLTWMELEFDSVHKLLQGIAALGEFSARTSDRLVGSGEVLSSRLVAEALCAAANSAAWLDARQCIITDEAHGRATPLDAETNRRLRAMLLPLLDSGRVAVLGGFIGATREGTPTTLGRGGSDFTAALVAAGMGADSVEIWTDVDGIMTADPRLCPDARLIPTISFAEAAELAHAGAKVLHPATLLPATEKNIPVYVRNSRRPQSRGTRIVTEGTQPAAVRAITAKRGIVAVDVRLRRKADAQVLALILKACERHSLELFSVSRRSVQLLVDSKVVVRELGAVLHNVAEVHGENHKAIVRVFGHQIGRSTRVVGQIFRALADMDVRLACPGEAETNLTLVVDENQAAESVQLLHNLFFPATEHHEHEFSQAGAR